MQTHPHRSFIGFMVIHPSFPDRDVRLKTSMLSIDALRQQRQLLTAHFSFIICQSQHWQCKICIGFFTP
jgi:hypothetical protein